MEPKYPIGVQTFEYVREQGLTYVDKTEFVYKLAKGAKNIFLSRPRRFGKSLLVTTLQSYFEGRRDLFKGLVIESLEKDWTKYPVIHLDLSSGKYYDIKNLYSTLNSLLATYEKIYEISSDREDTYNVRLRRIIQTAVSTTGQKAVVLIDEYDAPMLDSISKPELQAQIRDVMRGFFSPLKAEEGNLRFVFLTGITKFSQLSIFSELNNIKNISMLDEFSAVCGFTEKELIYNFKPGIAALAEKNGMTEEAAVAKLKEQYDGYRFSAEGEAMYNPYSILNALVDKEFGNYWFTSGTPTFLLELMRQKDVTLPELEDVEATPDQFDTPSENASDPIPVLYQSGYLTIKKYEFGIYTLAIPNNEVRHGFSTFTLNYIAPQYGRQRTSFGARFGKAMRSDDIDKAMEALQVFLASFPYDIHHNREDYYQAILYTIFETLNFTIRAEARTARDRVDILVSTSTSIFVMELKMDKSPDVALAQIDSKDYILQWKADGRNIFKVGISFSTDKKNVTDWKWVKA